MDPCGSGYYQPNYKGSECIECPAGFDCTVGVGEDPSEYFP